MNDIKEKILVVLIILLFSFWYIFTGYLLLDYFKVGWPIYLLGGVILAVIIVSVLCTIKRMKDGEY